MKLIAKILAGLFILIYISDIIFTQDNQLNNPYFGMKLLGGNPEIFPEEKFYYFFNNGTECYYAEKGIWYSKLEDGKWTEPLNTMIDYGKYADFEMNISPDGGKIFFNSITRQLPPGSKNTISQIWIAERKEINWTEPANPGFGGMYVTSTFDGTIYYTNVDDAKNGYIVNSKFKNGKYQKEEVIPEPVFDASQKDLHPCIAPDESYLIFDSETRKMINNCALFISFRRKDDSWTPPINMGNYIKQEGASLAKITPDGKLLFYQAQRGIMWWVSTSIIEELKSNNKK
ncbi:MAG: hypothetical protein V1720_15670 [bacterium]